MDLEFQNNQMDEEQNLQKQMPSQQVGAQNIAQQPLPHNENHSYLEDYEILRNLGAGYTAKVKLGRNIHDNKLYAVKIFKSTFSQESNLKTLSHEIEMISALNHPNLVNFKEFKNNATYTRKASSTKSKTYQCIAIILEFAESGELFDYVAKSGCFSEEVARTYFHQIVAGLEYLNSKGLCHRDIKPENLLFDSDFTLKLCDFGFASYLSGKDGSGILHTILGTESYMAPEIFIDKNYNGQTVDLFATGIVLFIMIAGTPPFAKADPNKDPHFKLFNNQEKNETFWKVHSKSKPKKDFFSANFKNFINSMLAADPMMRPSLAEIKTHPWFTGEIVPLDQIRSDFQKRRQILEDQINAEKEQLRQKKLQEAKKKNKTIHTGVKGFRSDDQVNDQFQVIEEKFGKDLNKQRKIKEISQDSLRPNDFYTLIDQDYLLKYLLAHSQESNNKIIEKGSINLNENKYKLQCNDTKNNLEYSIELLKLDEDTIVVDFKKQNGNGFDFQDKVNAIKKVINEV